jgi:hypothetical protein
MHEPRTIIDIVNPQDQEEWVPCEQCGNSTAHKVLTVVVSKANVRHEDSDQIKYQLWTYHQTVQCQGCKKICFRRELKATYNFDCDPKYDGQEHWTVIRYFPPRLQDRVQLKNSFLLPLSIYQLYNEIYKALCDELPIIAGIGIRAIIEAVCKEKSAQGRNLAEKIESIMMMGMITKDEEKILHSIRYLGNEAAHEVKAPTEEELNAAIEVLEHLLRGAFILPKRAENLLKNKK